MVKLLIYSLVLVWLTSNNTVFLGTSTCQGPFPGGNLDAANLFCNVKEFISMTVARLCHLASRPTSGPRYSFSCYPLFVALGQQLQGIR